MSVTKPNNKKLVIVSGRAHPELAEEVAALLGTKLTQTVAYDFANGETFVRYEESVRGVDAFVIQAHPYPINQHMMEQLLMCDALKRASAKRITVVSHSSLTPARTRSTRDASQSRPASWPTCTRLPEPTV